MPIAAINYLDIQEWVSDLSKRLAPATVQKPHQILSKILKVAIDAGYISRNPCARVSLPRIERPEIMAITPFEIAGLADTIDKRYSALVVTAAHTGLRIGELLALRRSRIDFTQRSIDVQETLVEVRGKILTNPPKTRAGRRTVPLTCTATGYLERHLTASRSVSGCFASGIGSPQLKRLDSPH